jgi:lipid II:glycine glycyltransferase (peptidoglycan interpeptide bridge formation enzyme)
MFKGVKIMILDQQTKFDKLYKKFNSFDISILNFNNTLEVLQNDLNRLNKTVFKTETLTSINDDVLKSHEHEFIHLKEKIDSFVLTIKTIEQKALVLEREIITVKAKCSVSS